MPQLIMFSLRDAEKQRSSDVDTMFDNRFHNKRDFTKTKLVS